MRGWVGVDLDGTLAVYDRWLSARHIGEPVPAMIDRVRLWLQVGYDVRIFTARVYPIYTVMPDENPMERLESGVEQGRRIKDAVEAAMAIRDWCWSHIGRVLPITCVKDYDMISLWDDRAVQVIRNVGTRIDGGPDGEPR